MFAELGCDIEQEGDKRRKGRTPRTHSSKMPSKRLKKMLGSLSTLPSQASSATTFKRGKKIPLPSSDRREVREHAGREELAH